MNPISSRALPRSDTTPTSPKWLLGGVFLAFLVLLVYWPGLNGPFLFDDYPNIVNNPLVQPESLDSESLEHAARGFPGSALGRPLATLTFAFNWHFGGPDPWGFKLTGLVLHLVNTLLVLALIRRLTSLLPQSSDARSPWFCFFVAAAWALHPLQVSTVLYVVQRMEVLSLSFVLMALLTYLHGRKLQLFGRSLMGWAWLAGSATIAAAGVLSKESALLFPLYALALELTVLRFATAKSRDRRLLQIAYVLAVLAGATIFLAWFLPVSLQPGNLPGREFTLQERLLTQFRVLAMYLGQIVLPSPGRMPFYYDSLAFSRGWLDPPTTLLGACLTVSLLGAAACLRNRLPLVSLGILWFFAGHVLTSNALNLELAFEHRNYFALLGVILILAALVARYPMQHSIALKGILAAALVLGLGSLCLVRASTWGNGMMLAQTHADLVPGSTRAGSHFGVMLLTAARDNPDSPMFHRGIQELERTAQLSGSSPIPEFNLVLAAAKHHLPANEEWWQHLLHKVRTKPLSAELNGVVTGLLTQRRKGVPLDDHRVLGAGMALLERNPDNASLHSLLGDYALDVMHDENLAGRMFSGAIALRHDNPTYARRVIASLEEDGYYAAAAIARARASELNLLNE